MAASSWLKLSEEQDDFPATQPWQSPPMSVPWSVESPSAKEKEPSRETPASPADATEALLRVAQCTSCGDVMPRHEWRFCEHAGHAVCQPCVERAHYLCHLCGRHQDFPDNTAAAQLAIGLGDTLPCPYACGFVGLVEDVARGGAHWLGCPHRWRPDDD